MNERSSSTKGYGTTAILCTFLGVFGVHRFYVGKILTGILQLITGGGFGIWWLIDLAFIIVGDFEDGDGRRIDGPHNAGSHSERGFVAATLLCLFLGVFGIHRFYAGKYLTGILQLITGGGFGIWWLIDLVLLYCGLFTDGDGHAVVRRAG